MSNLTQKLNQFIQNVQGQFIEVSDRSNIYQCYDLAALWVIALNIPKSTISHLYAYEIYTKPNPNTKDFFDLIPNTTTFIPQDGDIAVFDKTSSNVAGHVGVALGGGSVNSFMLFNQNAPLGTNTHLGEYNYNSPKLLGVLRVKNQVSPIPIPTPYPNDKPILMSEVWKRAYKGLTGEWGSESEIKWRLEKDLSIDDTIDDIGNGDSRFYDKWIKPKLESLEADVKKAKDDLSVYIAQQKSDQATQTSHTVEVTTTIYPRKPETPAKSEATISPPPILTNLFNYLKKFWK